MFERDIWLTDVLRYPCYKLQSQVKSNFNDLKVTQAKGLYQAKVATSCKELIKYLYSNYFKVIDFQSKFQSESINKKCFKVNSKKYTISLAEENQIKILQNIASASFRNFRLGKIGHFSELDMKIMWSKWLHDAYIDPFRKVIVISEGAKVLGFIIIKLGDKTQIDLLAIDPNSRGKGIAHQLIYSIKRFQPESKTVELFCETHNLPAFNLYISSGFEVRESYVILAKYK